MPCALADNADYPDYLKSILKEIEAGNDEELKACACSLKTPTTDEGCPILDENNKIGAFPFCWEFTEDLSKVGNGTFNPLKLTLKDAMWLYWQSKNTIQQISWGEILSSCFGGEARVDIKIMSNNMLKTDPSTGVQIKAKKELVCRKNITVNSKYISSGGCKDSPQNFSTNFIIAEFFAVAGNDCNATVPLKQYYIKEGNEYYFYPSVIYRYNGYWHSVLEADSSTVTPPNNCGANPCQSTITPLVLNIKINKTNYSMNTYSYQSYIPFDNSCATGPSPVDFNQGNLTISE